MTVRILKGDCREMLRSLPEESVHCVVTSPPYWGLRDYGTAIWEGGDLSCDHGAERAARRNAGAQSGVRQDGSLRDKPKSECRCGARRVDRQIGLERTPEAYVSELVAVFQELRRVLKPDGTAWLNLGDSYSGSGKGGNPNSGKQSTNKGSQTIGTLYGKTGESAREAAVSNVSRRLATECGIASKQLMGMPWRVALALQADGWWLRSDIIWHKLNPMPESVEDRPTRSHEYLFLLAKNERYFYDAAAIREPLDRPDEAVRATPAKFGGALKHVGAGKQSRLHSGNDYLGTEDGKRNKRDVWSIAAQPFSEAHFATFPPALIEPCIKAGSPVGGKILDPFGGAGTTGVVADRLGRDAILIELNPEYAAMAERRLTNDAGMFASVAAE